MQRLEEVYGPASRAAFGTAVFYATLGSRQYLTKAALAQYRLFVGALWERYGEAVLAKIAAFPPVLIEVEADGRRYDELHVGGGVTAQLFFSLAVPIMSRSIDTLIGTQSIGNLDELCIVAREQGLGYQLAYIPQRRGRRTPGPTSLTWRRCPSSSLCRTRAASIRAGASLPGPWSVVTREEA